MVQTDKSQAPVVIMYSHSSQRKKVGKVVRHENFLYMRAAPALSWRLDPDDSLSDWTLRVSSSDNPAIGSHGYVAQTKHSMNSLRTSSSVTRAPIKTYFVHKTILGVGPRRSEFFAKLFKRNVEDSRDDASSCSVSKNSTKIELLPLAAARFPAMLDYLYAAPGTPLDINTLDAVAMRHLASSFGIKDLFMETTDFIKEDLNPETAPVYLMEARKFKNEKVAKSAILTMAKDFKAVKLTALSQLPPHCLLEIVQSEFMDLKSSEIFSSKIAAYCRCRQDEITLPLLEGLTDARTMPTIAEDESLYFLHLLILLGGKEDNNGHSLFTRCMIHAPTNLSKARNLKNSGETSKASLRHRQNNLDLYANLPDKIKVQILEKSPSLTQIPANGSEENKPIVSRIVDKRAKKQVLKMKADMEEMKSTYDKKLEYLQTKLKKKEDELMSIGSTHKQ